MKASYGSFDSDSGAPVLSNVNPGLAVGIHTGGSASTARFFNTWTRIKQEFLDQHGIVLWLRLTYP